LRRHLIYPGLLLLFFTSCVSGNRSKEELRTVFRYNEPSGIKTLDPAFARDQAHTWVANLLFNRLVKLDEKLRIVPSVARSWVISPDGLTYTFFLRDDVYFHDNEAFEKRKVVASDVSYSLLRLTDPEVASPGSWVLQNVALDKGIPSIIALNDSVLTITLKQPFPPFLGILSMQYCSIIPSEAVNYYGPGFRDHPVGTGPFRFKHWSEGEKLILVKNDYYFEEDNGERLPYLDAVSIRFLSDKQAAFLEFIKGNIDFISGIDPAYKDEVLTSKGRLSHKYEDDIYLVTEPFLNTEYLGFMLDEPQGDNTNPLSSREVRKAINLGIDRQKMMHYLRNNIGTPGKYGIIPMGMPAYDTTCISNEYLPDSALKLLEIAGYPQGRGLETIILHSTSDHLDISKYIQHQLGEIGISLDIEIHPPGTLRDLKADAKLAFFRASWIADYPDEENYLSLFYSRNFTPDGPNYTRYLNPEFDRLYLKSQDYPDDSVRREFYRAMNELIIRDVPVVILYYDQVLRFVRKNVKNLGSNPMNLLDLTRVRVENSNAN